MKRIKAGEFKAKCLQLMEHVKKYHEEITITKHNIPIAKLVPIEKTASESLFGSLEGSLTIEGDIVAPSGGKWNAEK